MKLVYALLLGMILLGCKKNASDEVVNKTIQMDIKSLDLNFHLKKVHNLTDSIYFQFATKALYDCDQYVINLSADVNSNHINITLGNIYKVIGFCIYGGFPAIGTYKSPALPIGNYTISVTKENRTYTGQLTVTNSAYQFSWEHDLTCMEINPKFLNK